MLRVSSSPAALHDEDAVLELGSVLNRDVGALYVTGSAAGGAAGGPGSSDVSIEGDGLKGAFALNSVSSSNNSSPKGAKGGSWHEVRIRCIPRQ